MTSFITPRDGGVPARDSGLLGIGSAEPLMGHRS